MPPILLVSLDMLPSPLPTHFSAPLHFGHSYIYGVIRCSSPSRASRITAHTELWRAEAWGGGLGVCSAWGGVQRGEDRGIFKWGMKRRMEPAVEWFPKNERKMIRERNRNCFLPVQRYLICPAIYVCVSVWECTIYRHFYSTCVVVCGCVWVSLVWDVTSNLRPTFGATPTFLLW